MHCLPDFTFSWVPNPFVRNTVLAYTVGGFFLMLNVTGTAQPLVQRFGTLANIRDVKMWVSCGCI